MNWSEKKAMRAARNFSKKCKFPLCMNTLRSAYSELASKNLSRAFSNVEMFPQLFEELMEQNISAIREAAEEAAPIGATHGPRMGGGASSSHARAHLYFLGSLHRRAFGGTLEAP